jgi:hypothetical protein
LISLRQFEAKQVNCIISQWSKKAKETRVKSKRVLLEETKTQDITSKKIKAEPEHHLQLHSYLINVFTQFFPISIASLDFPNN